MKRIWAAVLAALLFATAPAFSMDWSKVADRLKAASFELRNADGKGYCTGFPTHESKDYALTAAHCVVAHSTEPGDEGTFLYAPYVDGKEAVILEFNEELDWAALYIGPSSRPALEISQYPARMGQEFGSFGFALEIKLHEHFRVGHIAAVNARVDYLPGLWVVTDQPYIGGMSGGPVVNLDGKLIAMVQRSDRKLIGVGKSALEIYRSSKKYWD